MIYHESIAMNNLIFAKVFSNISQPGKTMRIKKVKP
jgi:hypothetical protein